MTAEPPESPVTEAVRSLEVRWIFPGQLEAAVARWFARFPATVESREDTYLLDPPLRGLSVKVRGSGALRVKVYRGTPGSWRWRAAPAAAWRSGTSGPFPSARLAPASVTRPAGGRSARGGGSAGSHLPADRSRGARPAEQPGCEVELAEVRTGGQDWWTLGFEATGPADLLRSELQATAALVFAQALPGGMEPGPDDSRSYAQWLGWPPGAESGR